MNKIYKAFPGGKHKVLTFSYDDGKLEDRRLVEIFNKNGLRGTFNLTPALTSRISVSRKTNGRIYMPDMRLRFIPAPTRQSQDALTMKLSMKS